jgi:hypothetical protein
VTDPGFNGLSRLVFRVYLRHHETLTRYLEWLAADRHRHPAKRLLLAWIVKGLTRFVLVGRIIGKPEAQAMLDGASVIGLTDCVCRVGYEGVHEPACLFLGEAVALYERNGPYPMRRLSRSEAQAVIERPRDHPVVHITPISPLGVRWFPHRYCICSCRLDYCLPLRFAHRYGMPQGLATNLPAYSFRHRMLLWAALATLPVLWASFLYYRAQVDRRGRPNSS